MAALRKAGKSRMLLKATGGLLHGGEEVLKPDSTGYRILAEYVRRETDPNGTVPAPAVAPDAKPFFTGLSMLDVR